MKDTAAFRITGDILFYFAVALCFIMNKDVFPVLILFTLLLAAMTFAGVYVKQPALRILAGLVPAVGFFFTDNLTVVILMAFPVLYLFLTMIIGRFHMEAWTYKKVFIGMAVIFGCCFIYASVGVKSTVPVPALVYGLLFLLTGVVTLRKMRMGASMSVKWNGANFLMAALPIAGAGLVTLAVFVIGKNLADVLGALSRFITWIVNLFLKLFPISEKTYSDPMQEGTAEAGTMVTVPMETGTYIPGTTGAPAAPGIVIKPDQWPLMVLGILVLLAIAVCLVIRFMALHEKDAGEEILYEEGVRGSRFFKKRRRSKEKTNVERVRGVYREYLDYVRERGIAVSKDDTTLEILKDSKATIAGVSDEKLREIYIKARYGDPDLVTKEDAETAEAFLKALKEENRDNPKKA